MRSRELAAWMREQGLEDCRCTYQYLWPGFYRTDRHPECVVHLLESQLVT